MPRTTPALVEGIIDTQPGADLTPFINTANILVTKLCVPEGLADDQLEIIERWLSAHFYAIFDSQLTHAKAGTAAVGFQFKISYALQNTMWGQQAMLLDTGGALAAWNNSLAVLKKVTLQIAWIGTRRCWPGDIGSWGDLTTIES